ncbi:MAG: tRNA (N(6)-L-threonylcarbamoyladenosine(37)-C(2))-methylthiotransferase MtaB [Candidatus Acidiferrales bacterium]
MASFSIENFGCRATEADAAAIRAALLENGFALAAGHASADFVVLNSCTVTAAADSQTREAVRKIHAANPAARIVVTGCYAQRAPEEIAAIGGVAWVIGNSHQAEIPRVLQETPAPKLFAGEANSRATPDFIPLARLDRSAMSLERGHAEILVGDIFEETAVPVAPAAPMAAGHTRPILKIQDGCNNRCSYCVIPFVRGRSRSLPPDGVVGEVRRLVAGGVKEIVLSGINLGSYGRDLTPRAALAEVVRRILAETELEQLRFSSIEPQDVTEDFAGLAAASGRIAPHFHVPLQSGSDSVLRAMHRWYRTEHYAERIALVRRLLPHAAIGADIVAGFPGETQADFEATLAFVARLPFTYLHVFSFSARPGTEAAKLGCAVPPAAIRERARALRALGEGKSADFRASQAGRTLRALTLDRRGGGWTEALTPNYLKVRIAGCHPANEWHDVRIAADAQALAAGVSVLSESA